VPASAVPNIIHTRNDILIIGVLSGVRIGTLSRRRDVAH